MIALEAGMSGSAFLPRLQEQVEYFGVTIIEAEALSIVRQIGVKSKIPMSEFRIRSDVIHLSTTLVN